MGIFLIHLSKTQSYSQQVKSKRTYGPAKMRQ